MKTYQETVWNLAVTQAQKYYSGESDIRIAGLDTVAWIYGVTLDKLQADVETQKKDAYNFALRGSK